MRPTPRERQSHLRDLVNVEAIEQFRTAPIKVAIQKGGSLTDISRDLLYDQLGIDVPEKQKGDKVQVGVTENPEVGYMYARNKDLVGLVQNKVVDIVIVGSDRILEEHAEQEVEIADVYRGHTWPIVLATRPDAGFEDVSEIRTVATQYPRITEEFFARTDNEDITIIPTSGGTELYAYLKYGGRTVDAISDLTQTGTSLREHGLTRWDPPLFFVSPALITPKDSHVLEVFNGTLPKKESDIIFDAQLLNTYNI